MIDSDPLRWLLTVAFGGASISHLLQRPRPSPAWPSLVAEHRLSEILHSAMGLPMIAMIWPWGAAVPAAVWIVVFMMLRGGSWCRRRGRRDVVRFRRSSPP
ncbi:hypothetical protein DLJ46_07765 [Micromonospora globispora]|uniref:Uncharacterized protein n=1 Tax=Micromonospora globispora TaxID=1450148 RepID=A0A317KA18_9ACTN|nr:hypothetical protein DLJ46_07765 [Micromonospora globispora]RQX00702.1 hypothetical protein DKL51_06430 [Micromonospora globispora]